jgi:hypothetical protein
MKPDCENSSMTRIFQMTTLALLVEAAAMPAWGQGQPAPKYSAKVPPSILTPNNVQTPVGTLHFDGNGCRTRIGEMTHN